MIKEEPELEEQLQTRNQPRTQTPKSQERMTFSSTVFEKDVLQGHKNPLELLFNPDGSVVVWNLLRWGPRPS